MTVEQIILEACPFSNIHDPCRHASCTTHYWIQRAPSYAPSSATQKTLHMQKHGTKALQMAIDFEDSQRRSDFNAGSHKE